MLKVKNLFMMALLTVAVGLFVPACVEDEPEPKEYTISVIGGTMWTEAGDTLDNGVVLPVGDVVIIRATPQDGKVFDVWQVSPSSAISAFYDKDSSYTTFRMPDGANVTITAKFKTSDIEEPEGFTISVEGGTMWLEEDNSLLNNGDILFEDDVVIILSADSSEEGRDFDYWDVEPKFARIFFDNRFDPNTKFTMPDYDVEITAYFTDIDEEGYTISIVGGTMTWWEDPVNDPLGEENEPLSDNDLIAYKNDIIIILSATAPEGQVFSRWDVEPASAVDRLLDRYEANTTFSAPASDVTITAVFDIPPVDGTAQVRFTWEAAENEKITHISASVEDMEWWYSDVYADLENSDADFTAIPLKDGNPGVTEKIFEFGKETHPNKARYWDTDAGEFTATCGVEDEFGLAEIVANYTITIDPATTKPFTDGKDLYFEIAFDVGTFLSEPGMDSLAWFDDVTDDPTKGPRLEKKKAYKIGVTRVATRQYKKPGATVDVTYYVIRRPKV